MYIFYDKQNKIFKLDTQKTSYVFCVSDLDMLEHLYYGKRIDDVDLRYISNRQIYTFAFNSENARRDYAISTVLLEYPSFNAGDFRIPAVIIENADGTKGNRFTYQSHRIYKGRKAIQGLPCSRNTIGAETLEITLLDVEKNVEVELSYTVYPNQDVITRFQKITNKNQTSAYIEKAASLCLDFYGSDFDLIELKGMYLYERANVQRSGLRKGMQGSCSLVGATSHHENPFFALCEKNADEDKGSVYGFNLTYSGNFLNEVEVDRLSDTRVVSGINPVGFRWELRAGESFSTPEAVMTYSDEGIGGMSRNFHDHIRENIVEKAFAHRSRPIVINSWEGCYFDVTEDKILELATQAKEIGADTVVLDDGWFRNDDTSGLGDWKTNNKRFASGIASLSKKVHERGLQFGIWIEPEMVAKNSEFLKENPQKILQTHTNPLQGRRQYVLDLTNENAVKYIFNRITKELDGAEIDYIKWDFNRYLTETGSQTCASGEVYHRQMLGVYQLYDLFKEKYPQVLFESCAGGGGRFDLGMLYYTPQIWTSDNTDPYARVYIQYGTSVAYPNSCISCHFTEGVCTSGRYSTPKFRYLVASFGAYGYELDLAKLTNEEKEKMKEFTARYQQKERYVLDGDLYRIISPESDKFCAYMQVSKDKQKALFTFLHINSTGFYENILLKLKGLDEKTVYENSYTGERRTGLAWMNVGLRIKDLFKEKSGSGFTIEFVAVNS